MFALYLVVSLFLTVLVAAGLFWLLRGQKNLFIGYDPDTGGLQPKRRRTMSGALRIRRPDKTRVRVVLQPEYARPRLDGKGSVLVANIKTGQPMMPSTDGSWVSLNGIYLELAYADDTIERIRRGTKGGTDLLKILLYMGVATLGLLVIAVYQFSKAGGV